MNLVVWLVVGGLMGGAASMVMRTEPRQGLTMNIVVGVIGAILGGWLISPHVGGTAIDHPDLSVAGLVVSLASAGALLAIMNLIKRETAN